MIRYFIIFLTFLFLSSPKSAAQDFQIKEDCLLFREAKTNQAILILEDSILYKGKSSKKIAFKHTPYPHKLVNYLNFNIGDKTYLVHHGCGPVLEYRNDSIVRIDHSFLHQNQYSAVSFVYKNEIYFFGGYGLFTFKNILTKFDFKTKEWNLIQTFGNEIPSPRSSAHGIVIQDDLFIFTGHEVDILDINGSKECDNTIWKLHMPDMKWTKNGQFNDQLLFKDFISFSFNDKLYCYDINAGSNIIEIDFVKNKIKKYKLTTIFNPTQLNLDSKKREIALVNHQLTNQTFQYLSLKLDDFLGKPFSEKTFSSPITNSAKFLWFIPIALLFFSWFYRKKIALKVKPFNGIYFKLTSNTFYFKGKLIETLEETEIRILTHLILNKHQYISLNKLNQLFENDQNIENFTTIVKRREVALTNLTSKLVFITGCLEKEIIVYQKSLNDKRIKEIKLKKDFIRVK